MAKKSFKDNPALSFISSANSLAELPVEMAVPVVEEKPVPAPMQEKGEAPKPVDAYTHNEKNGRIVFPAPSEAKRKRLQLLLRPSTYEGIARIAKENEISVNETVNVILEAFVKADRQA